MSKWDTGPVSWGCTKRLKTGSNKVVAMGGNQAFARTFSFMLDKQLSRDLKEHRFIETLRANAKDTYNYYVVVK